MVGFNVKNQTKIISTFHCTMCLLILREPIQLICGHRQCKSCIENSIGNSVKCPQCQQESMKQNIMIDRGCKNDMKKLPIECYLCDWTGQFGTYESHLQNIHLERECDLVTLPCILKEYGCVEPIVRAHADKHYMTIQHQQAILNCLHSKSMMPNSNIISTVEQDVYDNMELIVSAVETLTNDTQNLSNRSSKLKSDTEEIKQEIVQLKSSVEEDRSFLKGIELNQEVLIQEVASLKNQMEDMLLASYDGTYIWRITSFREKMRDAESERQTSIYSPPFYSSPTGYKMRARLYLQGDGNARQSHISIFFVLMRGPNDAILKFPFNYKVTFCMYDQTSSQKHIIDSFRPDIRSNSFQRPTSDMNIASGIPKFFPLTIIQREDNPYVQNDTMFIKIMVDFNNLPKPILPFVLTLNPAIPANVQHDMIKKEFERYTQQSSVGNDGLSTK